MENMSFRQNEWTREKQNRPLAGKRVEFTHPHRFICLSLPLLLAIGEPTRLEWYNPQGERIVPSKRMALHTETSRSRLIIYNAIIEDAGIYRCQASDANGHTEEASVVLEIYRKCDQYHTLTFSHSPADAPYLPPGDIKTRRHERNKPLTLALAHSPFIFPASPQPQAETISLSVCKCILDPRVPLTLCASVC